MVANGPVFRAAPPPPDGKTLVYIYWPRAFAAAVRFSNIFMDGKKVAELQAGGYTYVYAAPGHHAFTQEWAFNPLAIGMILFPPRAIGIEADLKAGETRYVRFMTGTDVNKIVWYIEEAPPSAGAREIAGEHFQPVDQVILR